MTNEEMIALSKEVLSDLRSKPMNIAIADARKIIVWCELAARSPALGHDLRRDVRRVVKMIDHVGKPIAGRGLTGQARTISGERALLMDMREITIPLVVRDHWIILLAAQVAVCHPQASDIQYVMIRAIANQIQASLDEDIPGLAEYADLGWKQADRR